MKKTDTTKRITSSLSIDPTLLAKAKERAGVQPFSDYIRQLIENDLSGNKEIPSPLSPTVLVDLMRVLSGEIDARRYAAALANSDVPDQAAHLRELLLRDLKEAAALAAGAEVTVSTKITDNTQSMFARFRAFAEATGRKEFTLDEIFGYPVGEPEPHALIDSPGSQANRIEVPLTVKDGGPMHAQPGEVPEPQVAPRPQQTKRKSKGGA